MLTEGMTPGQKDEFDTVLNGTEGRQERRKRAAKVAALGGEVVRSR